MCALASNWPGITTAYLVWGGVEVPADVFADARQLLNDVTTDLGEWRIHLGLRCKLAVRPHAPQQVRYPCRYNPCTLPRDKRVATQHLDPGLRDRRRLKGGLVNSYIKQPAARGEEGAHGVIRPGDWPFNVC